MPSPFRLGIVATHPVQYYAPLYRDLAARPGVDLTVMFADQPTPSDQGIGFGVPFAWDVDLTSGYRSVWLDNRAGRPRLGRYGDYDTPEVKERIAGGQFDGVLVHGWNVRSYWQAMRACWSRAIPVFVRGDSQLRDDASVAKRLVKRVAYPGFIRRFAACLSVGVRSEEYFRYYGARRVVRSPHFVDNAAFAAGSRDARARARAMWGLQPQEFVVLFAGKLTVNKRPSDVIEAVGRAGVQDAVVLLAGEGAERAACEAQGRTRGRRVVSTGFLNQTMMPLAYAAADVLVLPSDSRETWGLVVNEAMACAVPAFVSDAAGCVPDLVLPGRTGHRFAARDVGGLASLLSIAAADRDTLAAMGAAARVHVASFTAKAAADGVERAVAGNGA